ncbi:MAG: hypothetical protein M3N68_10025, partial [Actinomycetota bacterium]|nr:hypothetical protein [Actinomycetota bacterium]
DAVSTANSGANATSLATSGDTGDAANLVVVAGVTGGDGGEGGDVDVTGGIARGGDNRINVVDRDPAADPDDEDVTIGDVVATGGRTAAVGRANGGAGGDVTVTTNPVAVSGNSGEVTAQSSATNYGKTGDATSILDANPTAISGDSGDTGETGDAFAGVTGDTGDTGATGDEREVVEDDFFGGLLDDEEKELVGDFFGAEATAVSSAPEEGTAAATDTGTGSAGGEVEEGEPVGTAEVTSQDTTPSGTTTIQSGVGGTETGEGTGTLTTQGATAEPAAASTGGTSAGENLRFLASGTAAVADENSVASGSGFAADGSVASGDAVAIGNSVASGCSIATNWSTASGGICPPEVVKPPHGDKVVEKDKDKVGRQERSERARQADQRGAAVRALARTGVDTATMALSSALAMLLGTLLLVLSSIDRRRKNEA